MHNFSVVLCCRADLSCPQALSLFPGIARHIVASPDASDPCNSDKAHVERGLCRFHASAPHLGPIVSLSCNVASLPPCVASSSFFSRHAATLQTLSFEFLTEASAAAISSHHFSSLTALHLRSVTGMCVPPLETFLKMHSEQLEEVTLPAGVFRTVKLPRLRQVTVRVVATRDTRLHQELLGPLSELRPPTALTLVLTKGSSLLEFLKATRSVLTNLHAWVVQFDSPTRTALDECVRLKSFTQLLTSRELPVFPPLTASRLIEAHPVELARQHTLNRLRICTLTIDRNTAAEAIRLSTTALVKVTLVVPWSHASLLLRLVECSPKLRRVRLVFTDTVVDVSALLAKLDRVYARNQLDDLEVVVFLNDISRRREAQRRYPWLRLSVTPADELFVLFSFGDR